MELMPLNDQAKKQKDELRIIIPKLALEINEN